MDVVNVDGSNGDTTQNAAISIHSYPYSPEDLAFINLIEEETKALFNPGDEYESPSILREKAKAFGNRKGFAVATEGFKLVCTRSAEPTYAKNKKSRRKLAPIDKQRKRATTRCGCSFEIRYSPKNQRDKADKSIKITFVNGKHDNGCKPSSSQLSEEKRKSGTVTASIHEQQIKSILTVMKTGTKVPTSTLRELMKPLYPPGFSLDAKHIFNFRLKVKRMISSGIADDIATLTITQEHESDLVTTIDCDAPEFLTEVFTHFQELLSDSLMDMNDFHQMTTYLDSLVECDDTFDYRISRSNLGHPTGFCWQTGVMRRDFELHGDVIFADTLGKAKNNKGWPNVSTVMLDGEGKICLPSEGITIIEKVDGYGWKIRVTCEMTPGRSLTDIKIIFADGIMIGETLLKKLGIEDTCKLVLDRHHLVSEDIGTWPAEFGLSAWSNLLKEDLVVMVDTPFEAIYFDALERLRGKVQHNHKWATYVEDWIHKKRHLFAWHIVRTYPGNLHRHGNAPAETMNLYLEKIP